MVGLIPAIPINGRAAHLSETPGMKPGMTKVAVAAFCG
jgi:hypothetical protein